RSRRRPCVRRRQHARGLRLRGREGLERPCGAPTGRRRPPSLIADPVAAMRAGKPVVLPTDTVYGLCADPRQEEAVRRLYRLKGREDVQPTALVAADEGAVGGAL